MTATARAAREYVAALNAHDADAVADLVTVNYVNEHTATLGEGTRGREVYRKRLPEFFRQLPGLRYDIEDLVVQDDRAIVAYSLSARPAGHYVTVRGVFRITVEEGLVSHRVDYWDSMAYLRQVQSAAIGVRAVDHVELCMPPGGGSDARAFYHDVLGMTEVPKPEYAANGGGCWFERADARLHLGVDAAFRPARRAHPALVVGDLRSLLDRLEAAGYAVAPAEECPDGHRAFVDDPFGNRLELVAG